MTQNHHNNNDDNRGELVGESIRIMLRRKIWYANFQHEGRQHRQSLKTSSKKEARRRALKIESDLLSGRYQEVKAAPAIKLVTDEYLALLKTDRKAKRTLQKIELVIRRVLALAFLRNVRTILDVNLRFVDAYRAERVQADRMPKTILNEVVIIRQIVNFALRRDLISIDPLKNLHLKKVRPARQPCWTRGEVENILAHASGPHKPALMVLADTGMRVGELKYLTWADVDCEHSVLHVRPKEGWQPKTGDSRAIPMTPTVRSLLESLPRKADWVLTAERSKRYPKGDHQISERRLLEYLKRVLKKLSLPGHLHTFRHAFVSQALTMGTPEAVVRSWVGHVDPEIMKLYTHIADKDSQAAMLRLAEANRQQKEKNSS